MILSTLAHEFAVAQKTSKKGLDGEKRFVTIACTKGKKPNPSASNPVKPFLQSRTNCKAALNLSLQFDGKWLINSFVLEHNHDMSSSKARYQKSNWVIPPHVKRQLELNDKVGIRLSKTVSSCVVEAMLSELITNWTIYSNKLNSKMTCCRN